MNHRNDESSVEKKNIDLILYHLTLLHKRSTVDPNFKHELSMKNILVTGSSGKLGSEIVRQLRLSAYKVIGVDLLASETTDEIHVRTTGSPVKLGHWQHLMATYDGSEALGRWVREDIPAGRRLPKPEPLFKKLDPSVAEEELALLGTN